MNEGYPYWPKYERKRETRREAAAASGTMRAVEGVRMEKRGEGKEREFNLGAPQTALAGSVGLEMPSSHSLPPPPAHRCTARSSDQAMAWTGRPDGMGAVESSGELGNPTIRRRLRVDWTRSVTSSKLLTADCLRICPAQSALSRPPPGPRKRGSVEPAPSMLPRYSASAWPRPDRQPAAQHPLANGFRILAQCLAAQTWAAPETQNDCWRLDSEFNRLDGQERVGASVYSPSSRQPGDALAARYSIFRQQDVPRTALHSAGRPMHLLALHEVILLLPTALLLVWPRLTSCGPPRPTTVPCE